MSYGRAKATDRIRYRALRRAVISYLGGKCVRCGFTDERALQFDHVNGGGGKELRSGLSNVAYCNLILATVPGEKYQLLCANCNCIKRHENGEGVRRRKD